MNSYYRVYTESGLQSCCILLLLSIWMFMQGLWGVPNMNSKITKKTGSTQVLERYKVVGKVIMSISVLAVVEC